MKNLQTVALVFVVAILIAAALFAYDVAARPAVDPAEIPPVPQEILVDVVTYDLDPARMTCDWPKTVTVINISSDKHISGFQVMFWAANDEGGPARGFYWGSNPWGKTVNDRKQEKLLGPGESITLPIDAAVVKTMDRNSEQNVKFFLYVKVGNMFVDNDPKYLYDEGAILQQDPANPRVYHVIRDSKAGCAG